MKIDSRGLAVTTDSDEAVAAIDKFAHAAVSLKPGMADITAAARRYPQCAMLQICAAMLHSLSQSNLESRRGFAYLDLARHAPGLNEREQVYLDAVAAGCDGDFDRAIGFYHQIVSRWPRDILAAKLAEFHCFETGDAERQLKIMQSMAPANQDSPHAMAMHAFALELNGLRDRAEEISLAALDNDPLCMWAQHCLGHVYGEQAQVSKGIATLEKFAPDWPAFGQYIQSHNWFHLATLYLANLDFDRALDSYRSHIWGFQPNEVVEQTDAILLLWYIELAGGDAGGRWREIAPRIRSKAHEQVFPFLTSIYLYALERTGESAEVDRAMSAMERYAEQSSGERGAVWKDVGLAEARATIAFARRDYDRAALLFGGVLDDLARGGGSDEQRAVFPQSHFLSLKRAGHADKAREALSRYVGNSPLNPLFHRWLAEIGE